MYFTFSYIGFHEDITGNTFGKILRDGKYQSYSDFRFNFTARVRGSASGYLLEVFPSQFTDSQSEEQPL